MKPRPLPPPTSVRVFVERGLAPGRIHVRPGRSTVIPRHGMDPDDFVPGYSDPTIGHASTLPMTADQKRAAGKRKKPPIGFTPPARAKR